MAKEPLGLNAYNGLALPANGEGEQRQVDSSRTMMTQTHSTANTGRFFTFRDYALPGSTLAGVDVAAIDADGGFVALSGATVMMELNSSGLYKGTTLIYGAAGGHYRTVTTVAAATTGVELVSTNSGGIWHVSSKTSGAGSTLQFRIAASVQAGSYWDIFCDPIGDAADYNIGTTFAGTFYGPMGSTDIITCASAVSNTSSGVFGIRLTAINSTVFVVENLLQKTGTTVTMVGQLISSGTLAT